MSVSIWHETLVLSFLSHVDIQRFHLFKISSFSIKCLWRLLKINLLYNFQCISGFSISLVSLDAVAVFAGHCESSNFTLFKAVEAILGPLIFQVIFRIRLSISAKKFNPQLSLGRTSVNVTNIPTHEGGIPPSLL